MGTGSIYQPPQPAPSGDTTGQSTQPSFNFDPQGNVTTNPVGTGGAVSGSTQFDADGYPLPSAQEIASGNAYNPNMGAPLPSSENPYNAVTQPEQYQAWNNRNNALLGNQNAKQAWQQQHVSQRQVQPTAAPAAPASPFQSSGVDLTQQGTGETELNSILAKYNASGPPTISNNAQGALDSFKSSVPTDMTPYYDAARKSAFAGIDNQASARGAYGSSAALGMESSAAAQLAAQQAKDEAGYGITRATTQGSLSSAADASALAADQQQRDWISGLAGMAVQSQGLSQDRNQQLFGNNMALAGATSGILGANEGSAISSGDVNTVAAENAQQGTATDASAAAAAQANTAGANNASVMNSGAAGANAYATWLKSQQTGGNP